MVTKLALVSGKKSQHTDAMTFKSKFK